MRHLLLCLLWLCTPALAQGGLTLVPVTITVISGQQTVGIRSDAQGVISVNLEGRWQEVGTIDAQGVFKSNAPTLELDEEGYFVSDGDTTPLRLDDSATLSMSGTDVFRIQSSNLIEIEPMQHALQGNISSLRVEAAPGGDKLAAYMVAIYLLMI